MLTTNEVLPEFVEVEGYARDARMILVCTHPRHTAHPITYLERVGDRGRECPSCIAHTMLEPKGDAE